MKQHLWYLLEFIIDILLEVTCTSFWILGRCNCCNISCLFILYSFQNISYVDLNIRTLDGSLPEDLTTNKSLIAMVKKARSQSDRWLDLNICKLFYMTFRDFVMNRKVHGVVQLSMCPRDLMAQKLAHRAEDWEVPGSSPTQD